MQRAEWTMLRDLQRGLGYISKVCAKLEKEIDTATTDRNNLKEEMHSVQSRVSSMEEVVGEMKDFLERKKKIRKILFWLVTVILSAALTTFTNFKVTGYLSHSITGYIREEGGRDGDVE